MSTSALEPEAQQDDTALHLPSTWDKESIYQRRRRRRKLFTDYELFRRASNKKNKWKQNKEKSECFILALLALPQKQVEINTESDL